VEKLAKAGFKQLKQMFADSDDHDHVVKWAADSIKPNDMQSWYLRNYKQNPTIHTKANQEKIAHFSGMHGISDDIKNVKLDKNDTLESGLAKYDQAEKKWQSSSGSRFTDPEGKKIVDLGNNMGWYNLKKPTSDEEASCMGHCGNYGNPHEKDQIFSLRKEVKVGNKTYHEPMSTAIYNKGWLGEMKGRANSRPGAKFHEHYAALLKHPKIKGLIGAGHKPHENFHFDDLSPELQQQVKTANPKMVDLRSNAWDTATKHKATASVPKIEKYQSTVKDIHRSTELKDQLDQGHPMDALDPNDLRLVVDHPAFQKGHLDKLVKGLADQKGIKDVYSKLQAYGAIERSPHLNDQHIDHLIDSDETANTAQLLRKKLNQSHVDRIVQKAPAMAAEQLKDHRLFNANHLDHIVQQEPRAAALYLNNHPLLNATHIDQIVQENPYAAVKYLKDHPLLNANHITHLVQKEPRSVALYLNDHPLFNASHIDQIVQENPYAAVKYLKDHPLFNANHLDHIVQQEPRAAAIHLKDHPLLNQSHVDHIVQEAPHRAAEYLKDHPLLNAKHIDHLVQGAPFLAARALKDHPLFNASHIYPAIQENPSEALDYFKDHPLLNANHITHLVQKEPVRAARQLKGHPLLNAKHIDHLVQGAPAIAAEYLNNHPLLNASHIDHIVQEAPRAAAIHLKDHPLFNASHIDQIVQKSPHYAAAYLKDHPLLNASHITHIVKKEPFEAVRELKDHPLLNASHIDHLVQQEPHTAAKYLKDHPLYAEAVRRAEAKKVQKSEATAPLTKSEKTLKSVVQKLKRKVTPQKPDTALEAQTARKNLLSSIASKLKKLPDA